MPRKLRTRVLAVAIVGACGFTATNIQRDDGALSSIDSSTDAYIPDASACVAASKQCVGSNQILRVCDSMGASSHDTDCSWSCLDAPEPHCAELVPSGGAVTSADLVSTVLTDQTITSVTINTDDGSISGNVRNAGNGVINGIDYVQRGNVGVFRFGKLTINGTVNIRGTRAAAIVSINEITINGEINAQGDCSGRNAGPGGGSGGDLEGNGSGSGSGGSGSGDSVCSGGGGGAYGGSGGDGGGRDNNGSAFGMPTIAQLVGGGGGGGGGGDNNDTGGEGGGGGGALHLAANKRIKINGLQPLAGGIHAGGCGGRGGTCAGGGGGAGGTILIEAPVIEFASSALAVNGGGGGGGGGGNSAGASGERATLSATKASGGNGADGGQGGPGPPPPDGGDGGDGGDDNAANGSNGQNASRAGGGGGAVGRMRFNTLSGSIVTSGTVVFSPALSTATTQTTVSRGMAVIR